MSTRAFKAAFTALVMSMIIFEEMLIWNYYETDPNFMLQRTF